MISWIGFKCCVQIEYIVVHMQYQCHGHLFTCQGQVRVSVINDCVWLQFTFWSDLLMQVGH